MLFNQMEAFVNVVKYKSFSKAAKNLYLSQPTISAYIKSLETELGVQLIIRTTKDVILSDAGAIFYEYALEILHYRDLSFQKLQTYASDIKGTLQIGSATVAAQYLIPQFLPEVLQKYPNIFFAIKQMDSEDVIRSLENFEVELGFTSMKLPSSKCIFDEYATDPLVLITPNQEKYQKMNGEFPLELFKTEPLITRGPFSGTRKTATKYLDSIGLQANDLNLIAELPTPESIKQAVHNNLGISIISRKTADSYIKLGYVLAFDLHSELLERPLYIAYNKNKILTPAAKYFYDFLMGMGHFTI